MLSGGAYIYHNVSKRQGYREVILAGFGSVQDGLQIFGYKDFSFDNRYRMNRKTHVNYVMHLVPTDQIFYRDG